MGWLQLTRSIFLTETLNLSGVAESAMKPHGHSRGSAYPVGSQFNLVRRAILLLPKLGVNGTPANSVLVLDDDKIGD